MGTSLSEATGLLLTGKKLAWNKHKDHKAGSIALDKPEQRRLLEFLLAADSNKVASGDETPVSYTHLHLRLHHQADPRIDSAYVLQTFAEAALWGGGLWSRERQETG